MGKQHYSILFLTLAFLAFVIVQNSHGQENNNMEQDYGVMQTLETVVINSSNTVAPIVKQNKTKAPKNKTREGKQMHHSGTRTEPSYWELFVDHWKFYTAITVVGLFFLFFFFYFVWQYLKDDTRADDYRWEENYR